MNETMLNKEDMDKVDACIDKALGEQAFGWVTYPNMKIQVIKGKGGKKPQQLRFTDIVNLCEALGLSWVDVCKEAVKSSKNK